jgi:hypothetical protein
MTIPSPEDSPRPEYEAYYDPEDRSFWIRASSGAYIQCDRTHLKLKLQSLGFSTSKEGGGMSEVDVELLRIVDINHVLYAGPLAGHDAGPRKDKAGIILVTSDPCFVEPKVGGWDDLERFISGLLGDQDVYLYGWLKIAIESLSSGKFRPGQIMAIAGEHGSGKTLLQMLLTAFFGREAKPFRYLVGETTFNSEMFRAEHLVIGDEAAGTDIRTRRHFGKELKQIAAELSHSCHKKRKDAFALRPFWRCSITLNADGENIMVLPPIDESMSDKIMLLKAMKADYEMPDDLNSFTGWRDLLISQLPAMAAWLMDIEIPEALKDKRYGITTYQHPELMESLGEHAPEERMWDLIESVMFGGKDTAITVTSTHLEECLTEGNKSAAKLFSFPTACGVYLARLAAKDDGRAVRAAARSSWMLTSMKEVKP